MAYRFILKQIKARSFSILVKAVYFYTTLNINIEDVDALVLSHGHFDHTGGLYPFLEVNKKAKIFCKKGLFNLKLKDKIKFIGTLKDEKKLEDRLVYVDTVKQIDEHIFIMPNSTLTD